MSDQDGMFAADSVTLKKGIAYIYGSAVHGDVIEFGCYLGRTAAILAEGMARCDHDHSGSQKAHGISQRRLWVLDSFEGFPVASTKTDQESPHIQARAWIAGAPRGATPEQVAERCGAILGGTRVEVLAGWFKDTLKTIPKDTRFAFVHMDCDYYESTYEVLDHLFAWDMISDGCAIYFDDWYCNRGSPHYGQQKAWADIWKGHKHHFKYAGFTDWGAYGVVGRRFIIHR